MGCLLPFGCSGLGCCNRVNTDFNSICQLIYIKMLFRVHARPWTWLLFDLWPVSLHCPILCFQYYDCEVNSSARNSLKSISCTGETRENILARCVLNHKKSTYICRGILGLECSASEHSSWSNLFNWLVNLDERGYKALLDLKVKGLQNSQHRFGQSWSAHRASYLLCGFTTVVTHWHGWNWRL